MIDPEMETLTELLKYLVVFEGADGGEWRDVIEECINGKSTTVNKPGIPMYALPPILHALEEPLKAHLLAQRKAAEQELIRAVEGGAPFKVIRRKSDAIRKRDAVLKEVTSYFRKINAAIAKGVLTEETYPALKSLDQWVRTQYGISIMAPKSSSKNSPEPPARIKTDMDEKQQQDKQPKLRAQQEAILAQIRLLGFDPKNLTRNIPGKAGVKSKVEKALKKNALFDGATVFNKAWERLRKGDIAYLE